MARSIGIMSLKGGVGKTLISVHLAHYLGNDLKQNVVLIDGDPKQGSKRWNARGPGLQNITVTDEQVDWKDFDWVVIDSQAHPEDRALYEMAVNCDLVVIPATINIESIEDAISLHRMVKDLTRTVTLVNSIQPALTDGPGVRERLNEYEAQPLFSMIHQRKSYEYARSEGVAVPDSSHRDRDRTWSNFKTVAEEVIQHGTAQ